MQFICYVDKSVFAGAIMTLVHNEQTKHLANALDRASTACFTVGLATPAAGYLYEIGNFASTLNPRRFAAAVAGWLLASITLHLLSRYIRSAMFRFTKLIGIGKILNPYFKRGKTGRLLQVDD